jgi:lysyl-tRNA synthetase class 2
MSDRDWRPSAGFDAMRARAALLHDLRSFFRERGVLEVETPTLSCAGNSDPNLDSFRIDDRALWLRTSPAFAMKRLLAAGSGDIYELGRVFRENESGNRHNPEFTMLEWYRVGWNYQRLMNECVELVRTCGRERFNRWPLLRFTYRELFLEFAGLDPFTADESQLAVAASSLGASGPSMNRDDWLDLLYGDIVERRLPARALVLVFDFPLSQAALSRIRSEDPPVAERFELVLDRKELANGYQELTDAREQRRRFERDIGQRRVRGEPALPLDERLLTAMAHGMPECSGVALGVDRLLMGILGAVRIDQVIAFPESRA